MTLYAVHHAWIDDHAVKAPVGIWGEGAISFYPPETESYRKKGSQAETEASQMLWAHWVEKRTEWGSTYGASWSAVESDEPMDKVLTDLRAEFLMESHPIKMLPLPDPEQDSDVPEEDSEDDEEDSVEPGPEEPAQRFLIAQSWWVASELVRRHPELVVHEMHPGGGQYDVLAVFAPPHDKARTILMLNRAGTMQVHQNDGLNGVPDMMMIGTWSDALSARSPHAVIKQIEDVAHLDVVVKAPSSTPRALAYRFIATLLTMTVNDRHSWDARNEFIDSSGDWWPGDAELHGFVEGFPEARRDFSSTPELGLWHEPESHFWAVLRDQVPVAIVSIEGRVYRAEHHYDLVDEYAANERRMLPLVASILSDLLP
jgi:hypothetical protein